MTLLQENDVFIDELEAWNKTSAFRLESETLPPFLLPMLRANSTF